MTGKAFGNLPVINTFSNIICVRYNMEVFIDVMIICTYNVDQRKFYQSLIIPFYCKFLNHRFNIAQAFKYRRTQLS